MESIVAAQKEGKIVKVVLKEGAVVEQDDCVVELS
jgi:pyruvate carboxylase